MTTIIDTLRTKQRQGRRQPVCRGTVPTIELTDHTLTWRGGWIFLGTALVVFILDALRLVLFTHTSLLDTLGRAADLALQAGMIITLAYYSWPLIHGLGFCLWYRQRPLRKTFAPYSFGQKLVSLVALAAGLLYAGEWVRTVIAHHYSGSAGPVTPLAATITFGFNRQTSIAVVILTALLGGLMCVALPRERQLSKTRFNGASSDDRQPSNSKPCLLWFGRATGHLTALWHQAGMQADREVVLNVEDAAQNVLVLGGIGAGKTTRLMQPLLAQLLDHACGGLLFDVKGDVKHAILTLSHLTQRPVTMIGPTQTPMNLLAGLTPEVAASFLKSALLLSSGVKLDGFWIDTASELCRNTLGLLSFLPTHYTLQGLYAYLFDEEARKTIQTALNPLLVTLAESEQRLLKTYQHYHEMIFDTFDDKVKSGVKATLAQALSPFNHPALLDAFCDKDPAAPSLKSTLDGAVFLVDMPLARWGLGAKVAYTFIKLRFFNVMQNRIHHPDWPQDHPVFFMCDEYQELISANKDGLSDLNFWDKSRSSKTIGIISAQSVSSFYAALGDRDLAHAILQNFRQKVCFRTEDQATLHLMDRLAGQAKVQRQTRSQSQGNARRGWAEPTSTHHANSQSITDSRESVLDATLFRNLTPNQAVALLSLKGQSMDDVLELMPVFLSKRQPAEIGPASGNAPA